MPDEPNLPENLLPNLTAANAGLVLTVKASKQATFQKLKGVCAPLRPRLRRPPNVPAPGAAAGESPLTKRRLGLH